MFTYPVSAEETSVYPGQYSSPAAAIHFPKNSYPAIHKRYNEAEMIIAETDETYKLQAEVPAIRREDISLYAEDGILFIAVTYQQADAEDDLSVPPSTETEKITDISYYILPPDAAPEFACAEFDAGVLTLHLPKDPEPLSSGRTRIVVY